jgi:nicotinate-nucleotide adenylyltransferase
MVEAAITDNPFFEASRIELDRPQLSYTIDTLRHLHSIYSPDVRLNLIVGGDNVSSLAHWHEAEEIFQLCRFLAAPRLMPQRDTAGELVEEFADAPKGATLAAIDFPPTSVSSSQIRQRLRQGKSVLYMVPPAVNTLLITQAYYRHEGTANA